MYYTDRGECMDVIGTVNCRIERYLNCTCKWDESCCKIHPENLLTNPAHVTKIGIFHRLKEKKNWPLNEVKLWGNPAD
jgi:hypothetical protein